MVGGLMSAGPLYVSEISPAELRGFAGSVFVECYKISIVLAFALGYALPSKTDVNS
jgi:hypothetical protein